MEHACLTKASIPITLPVIDVEDKGIILFCLFNSSSINTAKAMAWVQIG